MGADLQTGGTAREDADPHFRSRNVKLSSAGNSASDLTEAEAPARTAGNFVRALDEDERNGVRVRLIARAYAWTKRAMGAGLRSALRPLVQTSCPPV